MLHLEHVASWQLALAKEHAGEIVRALAWAGPERVHTVLKEIEGKVPPNRRDKGGSAGLAVSTLVGGRLDSECRHCPAVVAKAEGTLSSARCYSRMTSYALIADEVIQGCRNRLRPQVAAAM